MLALLGVSIMTEYMFASLSARNTRPAAEFGSKRMFAETTAALQAWFCRKSVVGVTTMELVAGACFFLSRDDSMISPGFIDLVVSLTTPNSDAVSQSDGEPQSATVSQVQEEVSF